ncbi:hypothetical protein BDQ17DRAFT_393558 [Cyathus striatus]|nr:hypothetical protein BDQ17DRAFT_393558 [Cyathus striatus]
MDFTLSHPEIEWSDAVRLELFLSSPDHSDIATSIDLLEVEGSPLKETSISYMENLGEEDIFSLITKPQLRRPELTILYVTSHFSAFYPPRAPMTFNSFLKTRENMIEFKKGVLVNRRTLLALQKHFSLSPTFLLWIASPVSGNPSYTNYYIEHDENGVER